MTIVPTFTDLSTSRSTGPTIMTLSPDGARLTRRNYDLREPAQIVVVISPDCHFAQGGMKAIQDDPALLSVFRKHATWLVLQQDPAPIQDLRDWNSAHPDTQMQMAYLTSEWSMLDHWNTPTFYFFKSGRLIGEQLGFIGSDVEHVKGYLKQIGLI